MKILSYIKKITEALKAHFEKVDALAADYSAEMAKHESKLDSMVGIYDSEYIASLRKKPNLEKDYNKLLGVVKKETAAAVNGYLALIKREMDSFFNAPINPDFANKINSIVLSGLKLTNEEFVNLENQATNHMEMRLLAQIAKSRTSERNAVKVGADGQTVSQITETPNPYMGVDAPNQKNINEQFQDYERNVHFALNQYCGKRAELFGFMEDGKNKPLSLASDSYFRNDYPGKLEKAIKPLIVCTEKNKKTLSDSERDFLRAIVGVDENLYPASCRDKVTKLSREDSNLKAMFKLDERYAQYVN